MTSTSLYTGNAASGTWSTNARSNPLDWIGLYRTTDAANYGNLIWWHYVPTGIMSGKFNTADATNSSSWLAPATGQYEFRYFCCYQYSYKFKSPTITVTSGNYNAQVFLLISSSLNWIYSSNVVLLLVWF